MDLKGFWKYWIRTIGDRSLVFNVSMLCMETRQAWYSSFVSLWIESLIFAILALTKILEEKTKMFFFNIEEIILNMFFGTPYYIENL